MWKHRYRGPTIKLHTDFGFSTVRGWILLIPVFLKGQPYIYIYTVPGFNFDSNSRILIPINPGGNLEIYIFH